MFNHTRPWTSAEKFLFRFWLLFFSLHILPLPYLGDWLTEASGRLFFGLDTLVKDPNGGSGDSQRDWIWAFTLVLLSTLGALIWTLLDRRRRSYNQAKYGLDTLVLYFLIINMFTYGLIKVAAMQMPYPTEGRLWQRVGDMSPMGMLWTFIGSSTPYQVFCGAMEVLGGVLLLFRRTRLTGALVSAIVMFQVFVLNMCYDVPVKIFSFFLLLSALYLSLPQLSRLYRFFISNQAVEPFVYFEPFKNRTLRRVRTGIQVLFVAAICFFAWQQLSPGGGPAPDAPSTPVAGHFIVEKASRQVDTIDWTHLNVQYRYGQYMFSASNEEKGARSRWDLDINDSLRILTVRPLLPNDTSVVARLHYTALDSTQVLMQGMWGADSLQLNLKRRPKRNFLLVNRGFHWINNEPFNR
jgi:hypothetical protein